jgi:HSP20 family protein
MNELRLNDFFGLDRMEASLRDLLRPWRADLAEQSPQIRIDGNQVTISAEIKNGEEEKSGGRLLRSECRYGFASRTFSLADSVGESKADAKYKDGVLQLTLPKQAAATPKCLAIG